MGTEAAPHVETDSPAETTATAGTIATGLVRADTARRVVTGSAPGRRAMIDGATAATLGTGRAPATTGRAVARVIAGGSPIAVTIEAPRPRGAPLTVGRLLTTAPVVGPVARTVRTPQAAANAGSMAIAAGLVATTVPVDTTDPSVGTTRPRAATALTEAAVAALVETTTEAPAVMTGRGGPTSPQAEAPRTVRIDLQVRVTPGRAARLRVETSVAAGIRVAGTPVAEASSAVIPLAAPMIGVPAAARIVVPTIAARPAGRTAIDATMIAPVSTTVGPAVMETGAIPPPTGRSGPSISGRPTVTVGPANRVHARIGPSAPTTAGRLGTTTAGARSQAARIGLSARMTVGRPVTTIVAAADRVGVPTGPPAPSATAIAARVDPLAIASPRAATTVGPRIGVGTTGHPRCPSHSCPRTSS
ncbi:hypothetical protein BKA25_001835 [Actinoalloteichus hymeniacidonis]|uniref:Uncharacterized protein n=1 Tax=Actinoalloteichus hymeniacidonis TaxID=340345 RepID=A0AAC9HS26_9PSEU|nr:hypothetical protein TL08_18065 [Actinoalloteichus hymeniacidonis]MBB5907519.1 hypothetical protein [Actinoalloteichus hymeniacidonis]